ncbi:EamA family transporter [Flavobacterium sp. UBA6031]|uniref:EamA family transporter n=1 Tax=Flavobacterium sp. UBA6031 TaxID=1946551 RepID=UPI0025C04265|nr:EamA family transporter [Flavobacterium sp. UBA6031]
MWWIYALLSALFAAFTAILAKVGIKGINSDLATAIRTVFILLIAWGIVLARKETYGINLLSKNNWLFLGLSGIATGLSWIFYFKALQLGKVSQVAPVDKMSVAIAIILSSLLLHEVITLKILIGTILIIAGSIVIIL